MPALPPFKPRTGNAMRIEMAEIGADPTDGASACLSGRRAASVAAAA
jgi:hypothetical protein